MLNFVNKMLNLSRITTKAIDKKNVKNFCFIYFEDSGRVHKCF